MLNMTDDEVQDFDETIAPVIIDALQRLKQSQQCSVSDEELDQMIVGFSPTPMFRQKPYAQEEVYDQVKQHFIFENDKQILVDKDCAGSFTSYKFVLKSGCEHKALEIEEYNKEFTQYLLEYKKIKTAGRVLFAQRFKELWY